MLVCGLFLRYARESFTLMVISMRLHVRVPGRTAKLDRHMFGAHTSSLGSRYYIKHIEYAEHLSKYIYEIFCMFISQEFNTSMIETTFEILQVTPEDFKVPLRVIYNDKLYGIIEYNLQVPQRENSGSGKPTSIFGDNIAFYVYLYVIHLL